MFLELHNPKTGKRLLLNTDMVLGILETDSLPQAISIAGHKMDLPLSLDLIKAGLDDEDDELGMQHG